MAPKYTPRPDEIPSGFCECGCGGLAPIAVRTLSMWRWFRGHPKPFIKGHHARHNHLSNRGPNHPAWKGGRWLHQDGYVYIYKPEHPAATVDGYVYEHRLVLEEKMGRLLEPNEHGHHINGIRDDNRPENLVALVRQEHSRHHGAATFQSYFETHDHKLHSSEAGKKGAASKWSSYKPIRKASVCLGCGQPFEHFPSQSRQYCSRACAGAQKGENFTCLVCGAVSHDSPSAKRRYCSRKCAGQAKHQACAS